MITSNDGYKFSKILVCGQGRSVASAAVCLASSGAEVTVLSEDPVEVKSRIDLHLSDLSRNTGKRNAGKILVVQEWPDELSSSLTVIIGHSDAKTVKSIIHELEQYDLTDYIIAVSTDHIPLNTLQENTNRPENIVVTNWAEPAHTTFFMEIVHNAVTNPEITSWLVKSGKEKWGKDPYIVQAELGVRGKLTAAMVREAMYLVEEGYASVEDIDRACRNDAGTYLPFAGHFQYMDLMGTYAYGIVMEKLNKELSNATETPPFFDVALEDGNEGMQNGRGLYDYAEYDAAEWEARMRSFSFEIRELMEEYPKRIVNS